MHGGVGEERGADGHGQRREQEHGEVEEEHEAVLFDGAATSEERDDDDDAGRDGDRDFRRASRRGEAGDAQTRQNLPVENIELIIFLG